MPDTFPFAKTIQPKKDSFGVGQAGYLKRYKLFVTDDVKSVFSSVSSCSKSRRFYAGIFRSYPQAEVADGGFRVYRVVNIR